MYKYAENINNTDTEGASLLDFISTIEHIEIHWDSIPADIKNKKFITAKLEKEIKTLTNYLVCAFGSLLCSF